MLNLRDEIQAGGSWKKIPTDQRVDVIFYNKAIKELQ